MAKKAENTSMTTTIRRMICVRACMHGRSCAGQKRRDGLRVGCTHTCSGSGQGPCMDRGVACVPAAALHGVATAAVASMELPAWCWWHVPCTARGSAHCARHAQLAIRARQARQGRPIVAGSKQRHAAAGSPVPRTAPPPASPQTPPAPPQTAVRMAAVSMVVDSIGDSCFPQLQGGLQLRNQAQGRALKGV